MRDSFEARRKVNALTRLGIARQAPQDATSLTVYVELLDGFGADIVEIICTKIGRRARGEFEPAFPTAGTIAADCCDLIRQQAIQTDTSRLLSPPKDRPVDPEKLANFRRDVEAFTRRRGMRA